MFFKLCWHLGFGGFLNVEYLLGGYYHIIVYVFVHLPMDPDYCKVILVYVFEAGLLNFQAYSFLLFNSSCYMYSLPDLAFHSTQCYFWSSFYQISPTRSFELTTSWIMVHKVNC